MLKRQTSGTGTVRKKKKGNATYSSSSMDSASKGTNVVENIRVWNISTSDKSGRVLANRKTFKRYSEVSPSEIPLASVNPGAVEETGALADSESLPETVEKQRPKRKRVQTVKENDSVSVPLYHLLRELSPVFRQRWSSGFNSVQSFWMNCSALKVWATRLVARCYAPTACSTWERSDVATVWGG